MLPRPRLAPSEVVPRLWQGGRPDIDEDYSGKYDLVVLAAEEYQPEHLIGVRVVHAPIPDEEFSELPEEIDAVRRAVYEVTYALKRNRRVLVTCLMGMNRSGLITALVLRRFFGMSADEAIARIRRARPGALSNALFVEMIESDGKATFTDACGYPSPTRYAVLDPKSIVNS